MSRTATSRAGSKHGGQRTNAVRGDHGCIPDAPTAPTTVDTAPMPHGRREHGAAAANFTSHPARGPHSARGCRANLPVPISLRLCHSPPPPPLACRLLSLFSPLVLGARFRPQSRVPRHRSRVPRPPPRRGSTAKRVYRSVSRARIALLRPLPFSPGAYQAAPVTCTLTPGSGGRSRPSTRDTESAIPSLRGYPECRPERCCSRP